MSDTPQEIIALNTRIDKAKETLIKHQSRREHLLKDKNKLIEEITKAGYNPTSLREERDKLRNELESSKKNLELELSKAETILKSIPE